jgi:hypothetical protein
MKKKTLKQILRRKKSANKNKRKKRSIKRKKKKQKGGVCERINAEENVECLALTCHGEKVNGNSKKPLPNFIIPDKIVLTFYSEKDKMGTAWINEARDTCYDNDAIIKLKEERLDPGDECKNYWLKTFDDPDPIYLSRSGGVYKCPIPYPNSFNEESKEKYGYNLFEYDNAVSNPRPDIMSHLMIKLPENKKGDPKWKGTPLSSIIEYISILITENNGDNEKKPINKVYINCNFCRGTGDNKKGTQFYQELGNPDGDHQNSTDEFNQILRNQLHYNVYGVTKEKEEEKWPDPQTFGGLDINTIRESYQKQ